MNRNEFKDCLIHYLNSDNVKYALLVNGQWGSGKSYFFETELKNEIDNIPQSNIIYLSAHGLNSTAMLNNLIINQKMLGDDPKNNKKKFLGAGISIANSIIQSLTTISSETIISELYSLLSVDSDDLLIIDDIERIKSPLDYKELFGFISRNFLEHNSLKVILIANEEELPDNGGKNYKEIKEKTIWQTLQFEIEYFDSFDSIAANFEKISEQLKEEKDWLIEKFKKYKIENFRTILFFFNIINEVNKRTGQNVFDQNCKKIILNSILIICNEYRNGILTSSKPYSEYIKTEDNTIFLKGFSETIYIPENSLIDSEKPTKNEIKEELISKFSSKYLTSEKKDYRYLPSISKFVQNGILNKEQYLLEIENIKNSLQVSSPEQNIIDELNELLKLDQEDFVSKWNTLLSYINENNYSIVDLMNIASIYANYSDIVNFPIEEDKMYNLLNSKINESDFGSGHRNDYHMVLRSTLRKKSVAFNAFNVNYQNRINTLNSIISQDEVNETISAISNRKKLNFVSFGNLFRHINSEQLQQLSEVILFSNLHTHYFSLNFYNARKEFIPHLPFDEKSNLYQNNMSLLIEKLIEKVEEKTTQSVLVDAIKSTYKEITKY